MSHAVARICLRRSTVVRAWNGDATGSEGGSRKVGPGESSPRPTPAGFALGPSAGHGFQDRSPFDGGHVRSAGAPGPLLVALGSDGGTVGGAGACGGLLRGGGPVALH